LIAVAGSAALLLIAVWLPSARLAALDVLPTTPTAKYMWLGGQLFFIWINSWLIYRMIVPWSETSVASDLLGPPVAAIFSAALYFDLLGLPAITGALPALLAAGLHVALLCYLRARLTGPDGAAFWFAALVGGLALTAIALWPGSNGPVTEAKRDLREIHKANLLYATQADLKINAAPPALAQLVIQGYLTPESIEPPKGFSVIYRQAPQYGGPGADRRTNLPQIVDSRKKEKDHKPVAEISISGASE
jgi:hypothetical protein